MDIRLALMAGTDIPIPSCQTVIHQPSIKEIAYIGEEDFFTGVQVLCVNKTMVIEDKDVLENTSNFEVFMTIMQDKEAIEQKQAANKLLTILFPEYKILMTPRSILVQGSNSTVMIDEENFEEFQETLRIIFCEDDTPMDSRGFNPANAKAKEIADKLMRGRKRVAEQNGSVNSSIFSIYISSLSIGLQKSPLELLDCTMFQLFDLIERYSLYQAYDLDIRIRLAGGKPDSSPDNWMKNIH